MEVGFVLPSCNYNIVLSEEDIQQLLEIGFISKNPTKMEGSFRDEYGVSQNTSGHYLTYEDVYGAHPVQYIGIGLGYNIKIKTSGGL